MEYLRARLWIWGILSVLVGLCGGAVLRATQPAGRIEEGRAAVFQLHFCAIGQAILGVYMLIRSGTEKRWLSNQAARILWLVWGLLAFLMFIAALPS
jgi:hypothetical protein